MIETCEALTTGDLTALVAALSRVEGRVSDAERVDQLSVLERVKSAAAAAQVRVTAAFVTSQEQVAAGWHARARECSDGSDFEGWRAARDQAEAASLALPDDPQPGQPQTEPGQSGKGRRAEGSGSGRRRGRGSARGGLSGVVGQVALARRESPTLGAGHVRLALALTGEMPYTYAALAAGVLSEWRAGLIVRETGVLTGEQRSAVDVEIAGPEGLGVELGMLGDRELVRRVKAVAYRIDPKSVLARNAHAHAQRRVSIRPAPETMAYLTALLPVAQAVAAYAALTQAADTARAAGDPRSKGQVMADTLTTRVTGQSTADGVPVEVQVVITDRALLAGEETPAQIPGYGTVPAAFARALITPTTDPETDAVSGECGGARVWLRRLYTHPESGALVAMDSTRRLFDAGLRRFLLTRDGGTCRTPWCDAPIRHLDHVVDHAAGGPTNAGNGQGLCIRCNHTKQHPGWTARTLTEADIGDRIDGDGWRHTVETTTPTGHTYRSTAPPLIPGLEPDPDDVTQRVLARRLRAMLAA